ncbi:penicillin acylase family protein [Halovulum sp. GXIMD14793]
MTTFRAFKWLVRGLGVVFVLTLFAAGMVYYFASRSLPDYDRTYQLAGLSAPVEIVRDSYAVPYVFAENDRDVLYGLGFAHAQDRLWQMTLMRRTAQGRLSELFGEETYQIDVLMRALGLYDLAVEAATQQTPEVTAELEAYAAGVNAYLQIVRDEALGRGAPEFFLFPTSIAPWTPADSIAIQKLMALQLTDMASREVLRAELALRLPPERMADLFPEDVPAVLDLRDFAGLPKTGPAFAEISHPLYPVASPGTAGASNAWAAAAFRTAGNAPLFANDPHLELTAPSIWMLARLEFENGGSIGGTIPGLPAILVGRSNQLAWGLTTSYLDDQDIYIEKLADDPTQYETPDGPKPFETQDTIINVKGQNPKTLTLRRTRHGPVIPAPHFGAARITPEGHVAALRWTALTGDDHTIEAMLKMQRAQTRAEAIDFGRLVVAPSQNLTLADADGVALQALGHQPLRGASNASQGRMPVAGWVATNDWEGIAPYDTNPTSTDPAGGIVVNTNNRITDAPYPYHWSHDVGDTHRIQRAERLLNGQEFHTLDGFVNFQTDIVSPAARSILSLIARNLWLQGEPAASNTAERRRQTALEALAAWNGEMSEHSFEPLVYAAWVAELQRRLVRDEVGPLTERLGRVRPHFIERVFRDVDGAAIWCDIKQSEAKETCKDLARLSLDAALLDLTERYGSRIENWRWGQAHQALHRHTSLGRVDALSWLVNIRQETAGGSFTLMRGQTIDKGDNPFLNVHGSGYRAVVDFSDLEGSQVMIATGQSGHFLSRHYDDLSTLWRRGEYIPMALDPEVARGGAVGITKLSPTAVQ